MKNKKSLPAGRQGFTLVEMLLYMGLLTILTALLTRIFTAILDIQLESEAHSAVQQDSRYLFSRFVYDINRASAIVTPSAPGVQSQTLVLLVNGISYTYALANDNLTLTNDAGVAALNSYGTKVPSATFTRYGNTGSTQKKDSVQILLTVQSITQPITGPKQETLETTITLR